MEAYACIAPAIAKDQVLKITLETDKHLVNFQVTALADIEAGYCYDIPLKLSAATEENGLTVDEKAPQMLSFGFEAACNAGKILDREAYYDGAKTTTRSVAGQNLDIDEDNSVIDYWFVQELAMNDEYRHPKSVYMYKDGAGKLFAGPVWNFDYQTFPNIANIRSYGQSVDFTINTLLCTKASLSNNHGNVVDENDAPYMWYPLLFQDADFIAQVKARWAVVYSKLVAVTATIATLGESNRISDGYNQAMWPIESAERNAWSWSIAFSGDERLDTYDAVIQNLQEVYQARLEALNTAINAL